MLVRSRMTREVVTASPQTTLAEALSLTRSHRIRHLPVLAEGKLVGLVTDRDLRLAMPGPGLGPDAEAERKRILESVTLREVMQTEIVTTWPEIPIEDAARQLYEHRIGCLPVMKDDDLVGILTETDVLRAFVELFGAHMPSSRIEVRMPNRPGELARVVRLIGIDYKINITGMVVPPLDGDASIAIIHLQTVSPEAVIEALVKLGYEVGWPSLE
jgi:acetoin utilization protein AcuB